MEADAVYTRRLPFDLQNRNIATLVVHVWCRQQPEQQSSSVVVVRK
jgi:hypothetical protein